LQDFEKILSALDSRGAFRLFLCALIPSAILIFGGWGKPFSPAVPVLVYGMALAASQEYYFVQLGPTIKDSPYFLGFILTLLEILYIVFVGFPGDNAGPFLYREIGAAIITTATGLFMRQVLLAGDQSEDSQDRVFRTLADEVKKDTVEFHNTQKLFVSLIKEFVQTREEMFSEEEKASAEYLRTLKEAAAKLGNLPRRVETTMNALENGAARIAEVSATLESGLRDTADSYRRDAASIADAFAAARGQLNQQADALANIAGEAARRMSEFGGAVEKAASSAARSADDLTKTVGALATGIGAAQQNIGGLAEDLDRIASDLRAMDQIVGDLIGILRERIAALDEKSSRNERSL
jgi:hypothetical protein